MGILLGISLTLNLIFLILILLCYKLKLIQRILNECVVDNESFKAFFDS